MPFEWLFDKKGPSIQCELCPKGCEIGEGQRGDCRIRVNLDGMLRAVTYGLPSAVHVDPIEKKPLNHFYPGQSILSLATTGCNLHCRGCQNWTLSQMDPEKANNYKLSPTEMVNICRRRQIPMVAFTYSEPLVFYEYTYDGSQMAQQAGIETVLVSAGYANPDPVRRLFKIIKAANIDLKAFSNDIYRDLCGGTLKPVLDTLIIAKEEGVWLEVTNLIVPTLTDDEKMIQTMCKWMVKNLGADTPLHFSRFSPHYRLKNLPPTSSQTLNRVREIAKEEGLKYVYIGNMYSSEGQNTYCPSCNELLIQRHGYQIKRLLLTRDNSNCPKCNSPIAGVWS